MISETISEGITKCKPIITITLFRRRLQNYIYIYIYIYNKQLNLSTKKDV